MARTAAALLRCATGLAYQVPSMQQVAQLAGAELHAHCTAQGRTAKRGQQRHLVLSVAGAPLAVRPCTPCAAGQAAAHSTASMRGREGSAGQAVHPTASMRGREGSAGQGRQRTRLQLGDGQPLVLLQEAALQQLRVHAWEPKGCTKGGGGEH